MNPERSLPPIALVFLAALTFPAAQAPPLTVTPEQPTIGIGEVQQFSATGAVTPASLAGGGYHTCMLMSDRSVRCAGLNNWGQLGNGTHDNASTPVAARSLMTAVGLGAGIEHTCALLADGTMQCWGTNYVGQLGDGTMGGLSNVPKTVVGLTNVIAAGVGGFHNCALLSDRTVRCWGRNQDGQIGNGDSTTDVSTPQPVSGLTGVAALAGGGYHNCALMPDGTMRCWGRNGRGQLGDGTVTSASTPVVVSGMTNATAISAGIYHTCALLGDGTVQCWGENDSGQIGNPQPFSNVPVTVAGIGGAVAVSAGVFHTCALLSNGTVHCWGRNGNGQLGNGTTTNSSSPVQVSGIVDAIGIGSAGLHSCALRADRSAWCWGWNAYGQLGSGNNTDSFTPVKVSGTSVSLSWSSSNPSVATIDAGGRATGIAAGVTTITAADGSGNTDSTTLTVTAPTQRFTLSVVREGTGTGTVTSTPAGIGCGGDCTETYDSGTTVTLVPTASVGSTFVGWSGGLCSGSQSCTVTISGNATVTANFATERFTLSVVRQGTGTGTVTSTPAGIGCGSDCTETYDSGTTVTLVPTASVGSTFAGWDGGLCSGNQSCVVALTGNATVIANFATAGVGAPVLQWQYGGCLSGPSCQRGWYSSPAVTDLDGDGQQEVIWGAYDVVALDGATGGLRWRAPGSSRVWPGIAVADLTSDGTQEIVVGRDFDRLTVYDRSGTALWNRNPFGSGELRTLAVADLENDGQLDIVVGTAGWSSPYQLSVLEPDGSVRGGWPARHSGDPGFGSGLWNANVAVVDMDGDGRKEVITTTGSHYITALDPAGNQIGVTGIYAPRQVWSEVGAALDNAAELRGWLNCGAEHRPSFGDSAPVIADVDGNGISEFVVVGDIHNCGTNPYTDLFHVPFIFNLDRSRWTGNGFDWRTLPVPGAGSGPRSQDYNVIELAQPNAVVTDLDGDGFKEILFPSYDGRLHAYWLDKTEHGSWPYTVPTSGAPGDDFRFASEPVVVDLNNDGHAEIIFTSWPKKATGGVGQLHIVDYHGQELHRIDLPAPAGGATWNGGLGAPTVANIDSDPDLEVIVGTVASGVVAYGLPNTANARVLWQTGRGNFGRTGGS